METKFQSSFIPKGPLNSSADGALAGRKNKQKSFLAFLALVIFIISVVLAIGMFGYKFYLEYSIERMGADLEQARTTIQPEVIDELTNLNSRIISTKDLISRHRILTPLFEFLEASTPTSVRFSEFSYLITDYGPELRLRGEARGYAALALQADILNKSDYFKNPIFSDLTLNERGEVIFSFQATIDSNLLSYQREVEQADFTPNVLPDEVNSQATSTSTSSPSNSQN